jgi:hypothetical protein
MIYQIAAKAIMTREGGAQVEQNIVRRVRGENAQEACALLSLTYPIKEILGCFAFSLDHKPVDDGKNYAAVDDGRFVIEI